MANKIKIRVHNDKQLIAMYNELNDKVKKQIAMGALRRAAKPMNQAIAQGWKRLRPSRGQKHQLQEAQVFNKTAAMKREIGLRAGAFSKFGGYKLNWINYGTNERGYYTKGSRGFLGKFTKGVWHSTGQIPKDGIKTSQQGFLQRAVESKQDECYKNIENEMLNGMEKIAKKYEVPIK